MSDYPASDFRVDVGRADKGQTFVRVVHVPSGKQKVVVGLKGSTSQEIALRLTKELAGELAAASISR
jgi:hypothetical protein